MGRVSVGVRVGVRVRIWRRTVRRRSSGARWALVRVGARVRVRVGARVRVRVRWGTYGWKRSGR